MNLGRVSCRSVLVAIAVLVLVAPLSAVGASRELGRGPDARGDVHLRATEGLSTYDRRSIDLRGMTVTRTPRGPRFELRIRRVATDRDFDQYFFVYLGSRRGDDPVNGYVKVFASTLRGNGGYDSPGDYATCKVGATVARHGTALRVVMPWRCVPRMVARVSAFVYTTPLGEDGGSTLYSTDRMRLSRTVDLSQQR